MNGVGAALLVLLLAGVGVGSLFAIAASPRTQNIHTDTFGAVPDAATNATKGRIDNTTAPATAVGGGFVLLAGVIVLLFSAWGVWAYSQGRGSYYGRG